ILRINPDGSIPSDNPFPGSPVFALGLRNPFGLAFDPATGELLATENGPSGRDEVNIIRAGGNYGWPEVMGQSDDPRFLPPIYATAQQSIAPTGITVYSGNLLPFQGDAFFCTFNTRTLLRIPAGQLAEVRSGQRRTLEPLDASQPCVLDITTGPDGALYFSNTETIYRWG
ncbi:MAG TPA: PQQ-dependent sugar dehydrogenase, partial [Dehalococcoidia bacterium]|nr:PQQ-dependent sugar dehydrogenase [Dehalococcoidia bacterium]